eukprot:TRINITY_DN27376_c0_g1_i2.p1 TRINITY_DN27376_c0_g1~~TRINITY_DN27376_c0_g1_i2.p1  ORF type:complete len:2594 (+),score=702.70 TRINITY_DN27376_c0_g1_i2:151-7932(+)
MAPHAMGGVRQFTILLKKNLLLKVRRPCATCFELTLPLVLFFLLAYTRAKYEIDVYGPFDFKNNMVFPMSRLLFADTDPNLVDVSSLMNGASFPDMSFMSATFRAVEEQLICDPVVKTTLAHGVDYALQSNISNVTVLERLHGMNASHEREFIEKSIRDLQDMNVTELVTELDKARREYLASTWKSRVEAIARLADQEWQLLRAELTAPDGAQNVTRRVQGWVNDACSLQGPVIDTLLANYTYLFNSTSMAASVVALRDALEAMGVNLTVSLNDLNVPSLTLDDVTIPVDLLANLSTDLSRDFPMWQMQANFVRASLQFTRGSELLDTLLGAASSLIGSSGQAGSAASMFSTESLTQMLSTVNPAEVAMQADDAVWWTSHFLRNSGSQVARLLGERQEDLSWMQPAAASAVPKDMRTEFGRRLYATLMAYQQATSVSSLADSQPGLESTLDGMLASTLNAYDNVYADSSQAIAELTAALNWAGPDGGIQNLSGNASRMLNDTNGQLRTWQGTLDDWLLLAREMNQNISGRSVQEIERDVLPIWANSWQAQCGSVNASAVGDFFARMHSNCPWYRRMLNESTDVSIVDMVASLHEALETFNASALESSLKEMQQTVLHVNATEVGASVYRLITSAQVEAASSAVVAERVTDQMLKEYQMARGFTCKEDASMANLEGLVSDAQTELEQTLDVTVSDGMSLSERLSSAVMQTVTRYTSLSDNAMTLLGMFGIDLDIDLPELQEEEAAMVTDPSGNRKRPNLSQNRGQEKESERIEASTYLSQELMKRKLLVAPNTGEAKQMIDYMLVEAAFSGTMEEFIPFEFRSLFRCPIVKAALAKGIDMFLQNQTMMFESETQLEEFASKNPNNVLGAIVFRSADCKTGNFPEDKLNVEYAFRLHAQLLPSTGKIIRYSRYAIYGAAKESDYEYLQVGILYLQEMLGRATARLKVIRDMTASVSSGGERRLAAQEGLTEVGHNMLATNETAMGRSMSVGMEQFPAPRYEIDGFIRVIQHTLPMFMILGWIYAVSLLVRNMVYEKQERLREVMRIQGLKTWVYWASWMTSAMLQMTVLVSIMTAVICGGGVLKHSDPSVIFVFFMIYSVATVSLSMLISAFFSRAKVAAACAGLAYYVSYMPYSLFNRFEDVLSIHGKNAMCLLSGTGLGIGMATVAKWELVEVGVQWHNIATPVPMTYSGQAPKDNHSMAHVMGMLLVDAALYQVLAWYVEKVYPGTLGLPQPWYFPFMPSYWRGQGGQAKVPQAVKPGAEAEQADNPKLEYWEASADGLVPAVQIRQLAKTFSRGKRALQGISLDMHKGTILGLLGHNGAGKSTTMSILTGLYPPTEGDVHVNGVSVRQDSQGVRKQLGVCLQHNALYDCITVEEHLRIFCCLKAVPWDQIQGEVERLLRDTGLEAKRHTPSRALSGGMKRKLSIGIALAGGSSVITLDEPTAGVDATSRRDIWQLLASYKSERSILLSTHFMDEADILSDRIAIIAEGQLTAIGSGLSLKRHFADGYMLTLVAAEGSNGAALTKEVVASVPAAKYVGARGCELSYVLPFAARANFPQLFDRLQDDQARMSLGITTYGLSAATMEEVFLKASSLHEKGLKGTVRNGGKQDEEKESSDGSTRSGTGSGNSHAEEVPPERSNSDPSMGESSQNPDAATPATQATNTDEDERPRSPQCMGGMPSPRAEKPAAVQGKIVGKVIEDNDVEAPKDEAPVMEAPEHKPLTGGRLLVQQFKALFIKRAISVRRDRKAWASQLVLPMSFVALALLVAKMMEVKTEEPPILMSAEQWIGTTNAGSTTQSFDKHVAMFGNDRCDNLGYSVANAFAQATAGTKNEWELLDGGKPASCDKAHQLEHWMGGHSADLRSTFGAVSVGESSQGANVTLWFNNQAVHAMPVMMNMWNNARFKLMGLEDTSIEAWNHPLPKTEKLLQEEMQGSNQVFTDLTVAITVILAMGFIPASFVVYMVHEKATNGKHQQLLSGITPTMYWLASYAWDVVNFTIPLCVCMAMFMTSQAYGGQNAPVTFVLLFLYGACMTPSMYCVERFFSTPSTAYVTMICVNIFTGTVSVLTVTVLEAYQNEVPEMKPILNLCSAVFPWLLPNYCLGRGMLMMAMNHYIRLAASEFGLCPPGFDCNKSSFDWDVSGEFLAKLAIMTPVWLFLRLMIEWGFCTRGLRRDLRQKFQKGIAEPTATHFDDSVACEAKRVESDVLSPRPAADKVGDYLVISRLTKSFQRNTGLCCVRGSKEDGGKLFRAVNGVSVGVPPFECFGLLGVNGAGKTTTMRMITGDTEIDGGEITVGGYSVQSHRDKARQHLGYCPQFDALPDKLNCRETLALYARIRGVREADVAATVEMMVQRMCLEAHQKTLCEHLSGGNKRKLSTALALIGEPDVVLLDEPSTGVDVGARRFLWDLISDIRLGGRAVILTSHSMEECEVLCTRLTIMVRGQMRCLGSPLQLKDKHGGGYTLTTKTELGEQPSKIVKEFMQQHIPQGRLTEESIGLLRYRLGGRDAGSEATMDVKLASVFECFEKGLDDGGPLSGVVTDYSVSQTSLEEVFLYFSQIGDKLEKEGDLAESEAIVPVPSDAPVAIGASSDV